MNENYGLVLGCRVMVVTSLRSMVCPSRVVCNVIYRHRASSDTSPARLCTIYITVALTCTCNGTLLTECHNPNTITPGTVARGEYLPFKLCDPAVLLSKYRNMKSLGMTNQSHDRLTYEVISK